MADGNTTEKDGTTSSGVAGGVNVGGVSGGAGMVASGANSANSVNSGADTNDVMQRLAESERARRILYEQAASANRTLNKLAENSRVRNELRGKIDTIVDRQESSDIASGVDDASGAKKDSRNASTTKTAVPNNDTPVAAKRKVALPERRRERKKRIWIIVGTAVAVVAIAIATVVVIVNMNQQEKFSEQIGDNTGTESGESSGGCGGNGESAVKPITEEEMNDIIAQALDEVMKIENLDDRFARMKEIIDSYQAMEIKYALRLQLMYIMLDSGYEGEALDVAGEINESELTQDEALDYYSVMAKIYAALGYQEMQEKYELQFATLYNTIYDNVEGE